MSEKKREQLAPRYVRSIRGNVIHWHPEQNAARPYYHMNIPDTRIRITQNLDWVSCIKCLEGLVRDKHLPASELDVIIVARRKALARDRPIEGR